MSFLPMSRPRSDRPFLRTLACAALCMVWLSPPQLRAQFGPQLPQLPQLPVLPELPVPPIFEPELPIEPPILFPDEREPREPEEREGCLSLETPAPRGSEVTEAFFGPVLIKAAQTARGDVIPFGIEDCDGDGDLDLEVRWSKSTALEKVRLELWDACDGGLPTSVTLVVVSDNASMRAYGSDGALLGTSTVLPRYTSQEMTVAHPFGIAAIEIEGSQICLTDVCWECENDEPEDGCNELSGEHRQDDRPLVASFGRATVRAARTPDDRWIPLHVDDCDGDGDLDVWIPWSEEGAVPPASIDLTNVCDGKIPTAVTLVVHTDNATFHAYDRHGNQVDTASVSGPRGRKELSFFNPDGIVGILFEGFELCLLEICWSCDGAVEFELEGLRTLERVDESRDALLVEVRESAPRFVRGDTTGNGSLDLSDAQRILGHLFLGTNEIVCMAAADADDSGDIVLSDAMLILRRLFLGGDAPSAPYPGCGFDPTPGVLSCDSGARCP